MAYRGVIVLSELFAAALAANNVPPPPPPSIVTVAPGQAAERQILTFNPGPALCGAAGAEIPIAVLVAPNPVALSRALVREPVTVSFDIDADGRAFNIRSDALRNIRADGRDIVPSLRASRFAAGAQRLECQITYTPVFQNRDEAPPELLGRLGASPRTRLGKEDWDRISPGDCREGKRLAPLVRGYPDWRRHERSEGARKWTYVTFDIDADGQPVNVATALSSGDPALDAEGREATAKGRFAGGERTGCANVWWTGPETVPAPPAPPVSEYDGNPACEIDDRWARPPRLTYPENYRQRAVEGWAVLRFDVAPWGEIGAIEVLAAQPSDEIGNAAMAVLRNAQFKPQQGGLSGCVDRVTFRIRAEESEAADSVGGAEAG